MVALKRIATSGGSRFSLNDGNYVIQGVNWVGMLDMERREMWAYLLSLNSTP